MSAAVAAVAVPESLNEGQRAILRASVNAGLMTEDEYDNKVAQFGLQEVPVVQAVYVTAPSTCSRPARLTKEGWVTLGQHDTYSEARDALKANKYGHFKWAVNTGKQGDRRFTCNAHKDCAVELRILDKDGVHLVQIHSSISHTPLPNLKRRSNSVLTYEQEGDGIRMLQRGAQHIHITHISCTYHLYITHISYTYHLYITHISYTYHLCITHISLIYLS